MYNVSGIPNRRVIRSRCSHCKSMVERDGWHIMVESYKSIFDRDSYKFYANCPECGEQYIIPKRKIPSTLRDALIHRLERISHKVIGIIIDES